MKIKYTYDELYSYIFEDRNDSNMLLFKRSHKKAPEIKIPFIAKVTIETDWPGTLNITVYEKSMIGYVLYQGAYMYFDKDGVVEDEPVSPVCRIRVRSLAKSLSIGIVTTLPPS